MTTTLRGVEAPIQEKSIYNRTFWYCYCANILLVTANALTFRFAEFVSYLGGTEKVSGAIVSVGIMAAVVSRLGLGQAIDRYGTRRLWLGSTVLLTGSCLAFLVPEQIGWQIYAARIAFALGLAGTFSCSIVYIQKLAPTHRRGEIVGTLGSSGFIGMITGPQIGDAIFSAIPAGPVRFAVLFGAAAVCSIVYLGIVFFVTRDDSHKRPAVTIPAHRLLIRYWPGPIVAIAVLMGCALTVPTVFLTRYATHLGLRGIGTFFLGYSVTAFIFRWTTRRLGDRIGMRAVVLIGTSFLAVGEVLFLTVSVDWQFLFPAIACGIGHALLVPAIITVGTERFPEQYRGSGTTLILGFTEIGIIVAAPVLGGMIDMLGFATMFTAVGAVSVACGTFFFYATTGATIERARSRRRAVRSAAKRRLSTEAVLPVQPSVAQLAVAENKQSA